MNQSRGVIQYIMGRDKSRHLPPKPQLELSIHHPPPASRHNTNPSDAAGRQLLRICVSSELLYCDVSSISNAFIKDYRILDTISQCDLPASMDQSTQLPPSKSGVILCWLVQYPTSQLFPHSSNKILYILQHLFWLLECRKMPARCMLLVPHKVTSRSNP